MIIWKNRRFTSILDEFALSMLLQNTICNIEHEIKTPDFFFDFPGKFAALSRVERVSINHVLSCVV